MKKLAYVFTIDNNQQSDEKRFDYMSLLLLDSIKRFDPDAEVFCGVFTNRIPNCKDDLLKRVDDKFTYIEDTKFYCNKKTNAGFLRSYCCHYFTHILDLTEQFENVVYLDVDVILTKSFDASIHSLKSGEILVQEFDEVIKFYEADGMRFLPDSGKITWYHNWIQVLNKTNKFIYSDRSDEFGIDKKYYFSDLFNSKMIYDYYKSYKINIIPQNIGTIPLYSKYNESHFCIHYDDFERRGTFICTKKMLSRIDYTKFLIKGESYLKQKCLNDPDLTYWRNAIADYRERKPDHLPYFPEYDGDLI